MQRGGRRLVVAGAVAIVAIAGLQPAAAAQASPDPAVVDAALVAVAREAQALVALGALSGDTGQLEQVLAPLGAPGGDPAGALPGLDGAAAQAWGSLRSQLERPSRDADQAGQPLPGDDVDAAVAGQPISLGADIYLRALDHIARFDGAGPTGGAEPPDPAATAAALTAALATTPTTQPPPPTSEPATTAPATTAPATSAPADGDTSDEDDGGDGGGGLVVALLVVAVIVGAVAAAMLMRGRRSPDRSAALDELLDVSRRLTAAASSGEVDRAIVRDAMGLVPAQGAALVRREDVGLVLGHESHRGMVVVDALAGGLVGRVAETGQPLLQVSASEPAIRQLPVALAAVPLVGGGAVIAVLLLVRDAQQPFTRKESDLLVSLAPIAAAAIQSASQARAAIETSLSDALTGVGNRRRLDEDLAAAAAAGAQIVVVVVDVDHFKAVNDTYGHQAGDAVLRSVADGLRASVRPLDAVYRQGGEEFCIVLDDGDLRAGADVAERARLMVASTVTPTGGAGAATVRVTASFGVAAGPASRSAEVLAAADAALYAAKEAGRDRVVVSEP